MAVIPLFLGLLLATGHALAAALDVNVVSRDGKALRHAAVLATWPGAEPPQPRGVPAVVSQKDIAFHPHMLIVPVGTEVAFPNRDRTQHHVYSFSRARVFDIKLYIGRPERPIVFDKPGVVTLGCNIHDQMQAFVVASDAPRWAVSDGNGHAMLANLPAGKPVSLSIWHPWMNSEQTRAKRTVSPGAGRVTVELDVDPPPPPPPSRGPSLQDRFNALAR